MTVTLTETSSLTTPWPHQQEAIDYAADKPGTMLAMEMGTGKTLAAIHLLHLWGAQRVLILCPRSVMEVWSAEFERHAPNLGWEVPDLRTGTVAKRMEKVRLWHALQSGRPVAVVLNYDALSYGGAETCLRGLRWDALVLDESHRLKAAAGKQSRVVSRVSDAIPRRLALTGTPLPHSPLDAYAQFRAIDKSIFGTSNAVFTAKYGIKGGYMGREIVGYQRADELHERMYSATYRCRAQDVLSLPEATEITRYCDLDPATRKIYRSLEKDLIADIKGGTVSASNALVRLLRLQQVTSGYAPLDGGEGEAVCVGTSKRDLLEELLEDLSPVEEGAAQEPVVIFARFKHDLLAIREVAGKLGLRAAELSGSHNDLRMWQGGGADVLAVQLQAGGLGVDLTRARYCVYYSTDFSLGNYLQSKARVHRPGQTRPVTYIHLVARGTVDEIVIRALKNRWKVVENIVDNLAGRY